MPASAQQRIPREVSEERIMKVMPGGIEILLSKERTLLSHERTMIAVAQLALAITALGFLIIRFFADESGYEWFFVIGTGLVIVSGWLFYHAFRDYRHYQKKLAHLHEKRGHLDEVYLSELEDKTAATTV